MKRPDAGLTAAAGRGRALGCDLGCDLGRARARLRARSLMAAALVCLALIGAGPAAADALAPLTDAERIKVGLLLIRAGRPRGAARMFSSVLSRNPGLVRVRLELAKAYFLSRQWGRARGAFLSVLAADIPAPVRAGVLRVLRDIDARRGFEWDAQLAFVRLGDTRDYDSDTVFMTVGATSLPFTIDGRGAKTVPGLNYLLSAAVSENIAALSGANMRTSGFGQLTVSGDEGPGSRFDDTTLTAQTGLRLIHPQSVVTLAPFASRRFAGGSVLEDRLGVRTAFELRRRTGTAVGLSAGLAGIDRHGSRDLDGHAVTAGLSVSHPFTPRATLGMRLNVEDRRARSAAADYRRTRLTAFAAFDVGAGITLRPSAHVERKTFRTPAPAVADETGRALALSVESSRMILGNGFTPYARFAFERVTSGIEAFSFRRTSVSVGLERRF